MDDDPLKHFKGQHPGWLLSAMFVQQLPTIMKYAYGTVLVLYLWPHIKG